MDYRTTRPDTEGIETNIWVTMDAVLFAIELQDPTQRGLRLGVAVFGHVVAGIG